jgi:ornithine decarboxylase
MQKSDQKAIDIENEYSQLSLFLKDHNVEIPESQDLDTYKMIELIFEKNNPSTAFYIINLGDIIRQLQLWREMFPFIEPRYAVKCNPNRVICQLLGLLGVGFDVASKNEINLVKEYVGDIAKVIYANPYKEPSSIQYARQMDVDTATFDSESELLKMKLYHPGCRLLIRLKVDDRGSVCKFSDKFGVDMTEVYDLLSYAKHMRLRVEGICFHVGSGCKNPAQYYSALKMARDVFEIAEELGLQFNIIDIGGGFPGLQDDASLDLIRGIQENVRSGLIDFFAKDFQIPGLDYQRPEDQSDDELPRLELIAEPGRFFVQSSHTLLVNIIGKKVKYIAPGSITKTCSSPEPNPTASSAEDGAANTVDPGFQAQGRGAAFHSNRVHSTEIASAYNPDDAVRPTGKSKYIAEEREKVYNYYLNDGIYGSFNCLVFDHAKAEVLPYNERDGARYKSVIFGPTCDSVDKISANVELPELEIGEWCFVKNFGAYTVAAASDFNGFTKLKAFYVLC